MRPNFLYVFKATRWRGSRAVRPPTRPALGSATAGRPATRPRKDSAADDQQREEARTFPHGEGQTDGEAAAGRWPVRSSRMGPVGSVGFTHLFGPGPASGKARGPLVQIPGRLKACPSCRPAYGPLTMPDPNPNRTPAKAHSTALTRVAV
ncbi:predicted protein [Streptomyces sp. C]|nr:predicted protein [Streptomyces sp. C]